jgi:uncharacterized damage-inducible protein DinB
MSGMDNGTTPVRIPIAEDSTPAEILVRYATGPALLRATVAGMDDAQLHARPVEGKMSTQEVVNHIVDSERGLTQRMKNAIAGQEVPVMAGGHPAGVAREERDLAQDLEALEEIRARNVEAFDALPADVWERVAMRREDRAVTVRGMLLMLTRHLEGHVTAIEEKRSALGL